MAGGCCCCPHVPSWRGGADQPIWPGGCGRCGAHLAGQMWGLGEGVAGSCVSISLSFPLSPLWVSGHAGCRGVGRRGGTGVLSHPAVGLGWLLSPGGVQAAPGPVGAWAGTKICFFCLRCRAARVEGPYGPLCASLINPGMQVRRCKSR